MTSAEPSSGADRPVGRYERLAWDRHYRDLEAAYPDGMPTAADPDAWRVASRHPLGYWFDPWAGERPIEWIETTCKHHKGEWSGQPLELEETWQRPILRIVFGWKRPDGSRRFRIAYIEVPRKNGKSSLTSGLGLYLLLGDGEPGAEIYASATKKDQAKIVWDSAAAMVRASPDLADLVTIRRNTMTDGETLSKFEPLGADSKTLDGLNPHGNLVDELHAHRDRGVWDVLDTAMGARRQPITIAITTAGTYEPESIGWQQHDHAVQVLDQSIDDPEFFAFIAAADDADDWRAPATWAKANPNLGVSVKTDYLAAQCRKAELQPGFLNTFLRLHLNRWTQQTTRWLSVDAWRTSDPRTLAGPSWAEYEAGLAGRPCYAGLDLSTKIDMTAVVLVFPPAEDGTDQAWSLVPRFYVPADTIVEKVRRDRVPYDAWARDGWVRTTPGNVTDYDFIHRDIVDDLAARYEVRELAFDPWNATQSALRLAAEGLTVVEMRQGFGSLSEPSKEFERLLVAGRWRHGGHPVLRWNVANVAKREDPAGNVKPDKGTSTGRIDGVVAAIMGLGRAALHLTAQSVYETREIEWLD